MKTGIENGALVIYLSGRFDSVSVQAEKESIDRILKADPGRDFLFDAEELTYISSAGLRVLLSIHKTVKQGFTIRNVSPEVYEILEVSGFSTFLNVKRKPRNVSVEGCPVIGRGALGTVYRLDPDTIVKVYSANDPMQLIEREQKRARQAFLKGIPTAIPFDIVRVGDSFGTVFELIKARSCSDLLAENAVGLEEMTEMYADLLRLVHSALSDKGELPDARMEYIRYLDAAAGILSEETIRRIRGLILDMPEDPHVIHGDIHLKNIMFSGGEMILIDMETMSCGSPVFDFAGLYMTYIAFNEDEPDNTLRFLGLSRETCEELFYGTLGRYLNVGDAAVRQETLERIMLLGYVRFVYVLSFIGGSPECLETRLRHSRQHLEELCARVDRLSL